MIRTKQLSIHLREFNGSGARDNKIKENQEPFTISNSTRLSKNFKYVFTKLTKYVYENKNKI